MVEALGLAGSLGLWYAAILVIVRSWNRRLELAAQAGVALESTGLEPLTVRCVVRNHAIGWTVFFAALFVLLASADFTLWQRAGIAISLGVVYGSIWFAKSPRGEAAESLPRRRRAASDGWYWLLAVSEWSGYLAVVCFATALIYEVVA